MIWFGVWKKEIKRSRGGVDGKFWGRIAILEMDWREMIWGCRCSGVVEKTQEEWGMERVVG